MAEAMARLVPVGGASDELVSLVEGLCSGPPLAGRDELKAGLWLYVDELDRSHDYSQSIHTPTGSYWHAIMHRREGDFPNSKYWYRNAGSHPAMSGMDPYRFVDRVARAGGDDAELVAQQREEWRALFEWCAGR